MATTRAQMKAAILTIINKNSGYQGFMTDDKLNDAIQDSIDYIETEMFEAGEGWNNQIININMAAGTFEADLPDDTVVINAVRYLVNNIYVPIEYNSAEWSPQVKNTSDLTNYPVTYRLIDGNKLYFNPAPSNVGTAYIQVEVTKHSTLLALDADDINTQFSRGLLNYVKWRSCSLLLAQTGNANPEWLRYEGQWFEKMKFLVSKRNKKPTFIRDFDSL